MTAPRIGELLEKLREMDPDAYMAWCELFDEIYDIDYDCIDWDSFAGAIYLLQGVIQDAIAARGWSWDLYAVIGENVRGSISLDKKKIDFDGWATTPAEALLAAYVAALEAEETR